MWRALFKALFAAIAEYFREQRIERDYQEALIENARRDAEARIAAGANATRERMRDAAQAGTDLDALRERMRNRDPDTK